MRVKLCLIKPDGLCDENLQSWGSVVLGVARLICVGGTLGVSSGHEFYLRCYHKYHGSVAHGSMASNQPLKSGCAVRGVPRPKAQGSFGPRPVAVAVRGVPRLKALGPANSKIQRSYSKILRILVQHWQGSSRNLPMPFEPQRPAALFGGENLIGR